MGTPWGFSEDPQEKLQEAPTHSTCSVVAPELAGSKCNGIRPGSGWGSGPGSGWGKDHGVRGGGGSEHQPSNSGQRGRGGGFLLGDSPSCPGGTSGKEAPRSSALGWDLPPPLHAAGSIPRATDWETEAGAKPTAQPLSGLRPRPPPGSFPEARGQEKVSGCPSGVGGRLHRVDAVALGCG